LPIGDTGAAILAHPDIPDHASRRSLLRIGIPSYEQLQFMCWCLHPNRHVWSFL